MFSFKVFFGARLAAFICLTPLRTTRTAVAFSEVEIIVFAAEGLRLGHDFPFNCGIRD